MAAPRHPWRLAALILTATACFGCNLLSLPFFLATGMDPKHEPKCKLASTEKDKEVRLVLIAYSGMETRPEFLRVDRELTTLLARELLKGFKENKEKVTIVAPSKIEKYKDEHPNWRTLGAAEIGKYFDADYVIDLEIESLSLYEPGSGNQLYRGRGSIAIAVADVSKPDEDPMYREVYTAEYPKARGPVPVGDGNANQFRQLFLAQVAKELSWRFTAHPTSDDISCTD
jgi:hypothetical protein